QMLPPHMAVYAGSSNILVLRGGFQTQHMRILRYVGTNEVTILGPLATVIFDPQFQTGNLSAVDLPDEPGIGIAAVVAFLHDGAPLVNISGILCRPAHPDEFRNAFLRKMLKISYGGFRANEPGVGDEKIRAAVDEPRLRLHEHAMAYGGLDINDHIGQSFD